MAMPFRLLSRRAGPLGLALTAYDIWRRLPPKQRRQILDATRKHGPRVAARVMNGAAKRAPRRPR
ncbi:MAG: hypothetical protein QOK13_206 [Gaiellaceae bacterium]|nr:hypothetical protein [Gaiellaceae bacterium]MDX6492218.1 hypothetical protein [Gaiellaceae bacterium]MDX6509748.1 hypothetical protein [Gaiellaceae bacterium]